MLKTIKPRHRRTALMLAQGIPATKIAPQVHVTHKTIYVWQKDPRFREMVESYITDLETEAMEIMRGKTKRAAEVLGELMDSDASGNVRASAAKFILEKVFSNGNQHIEKAQIIQVAAQLESMPRKEKEKMLGG